MAAKKSGSEVAASSTSGGASSPAKSTSPGASSAYSPASEKASKKSGKKGAKVKKRDSSDASSSSKGSSASSDSDAKSDKRGSGKKKHVEGQKWGGVGKSSKASKGKASSGGSKKSASQKGKGSKVTKGRRWGVKTVIDGEDPDHKEREKKEKKEKQEREKREAKDRQSKSKTDDKQRRAEDKQRKLDNTVGRRGRALPYLSYYSVAAEATDNATDRDQRVFKSVHRTHTFKEDQLRGVLIIIDYTVPHAAGEESDHAEDTGSVDEYERLLAIMQAYDDPNVRIALGLGERDLAVSDGSASGGSVSNDGSVSASQDAPSAGAASSASEDQSHQDPTSTRRERQLPYIRSRGMAVVVYDHAKDRDQRTIKSVHRKPAITTKFIRGHLITINYAVPHPSSEESDHAEDKDPLSQESLDRLSALVKAHRGDRGKMPSARVSVRDDDGNSHEIWSMGSATGASASEAGGGVSAASSDMVEMSAVGSSSA